MSHMVIYRGVDGKPGYHQTDDIHDAVNFVETMRNEEGVEHARIFRLEEVVFEYRPYYRVELTNGAAISENGNGTAELAGGAAQVGTGSDEPAAQESVETAEEAVDVVEVTDVEEDGEDVDVSENGEKAEAGAGKKGLFGR